jgi:GT2 family glycosyltransferase
MTSMAVEILPGNGRPADPLVSICIPNYNGAEYIEQCIRSVLAQERDYEIEIILHDDASTDESLQIIRAQFPQVEVLANKENVGFCISNNRMVAHSRGEYVLLLNNDAVLRPGSLKAFRDFAVTQPIQGILGLPQYTLYDGSLVDRGYEFDPFMNPIPVFAEGPTEVGAVTGACLWISRNLWDTIGGFPPWFESVAEDIFLCCAARLLGYSVTILNEPGFDHWIGKNLGGGKIVDKKLSSTVRRRSLTERNKTWVMMMCYPLPVLLILLPFHFLFLGIEGLVMLLMKRDWGTVDAIYAKLPKRLMEFKVNVSVLRSRLQSQKQCRLGVYFSMYKIIPWKLVMLFRHGLPHLTK